MEQRLIGIFGLGIFGTSIARTLEEYDVDVLAIDQDEENINDVADVVLEAVVGDFTDEELLKNIGIEDCDAVVIASGSSLEASALAVIHLKKLGVPRIICKAKNHDYANILKTVGADTIIMPERETGQRLARTLMRSNIEDVLELDHTTSIVEFHPPKNWVDKSFKELDISNNYSINIIGIRDEKYSPLNIHLDEQATVHETDILVGITANENLENHKFLTK